MTLHTQTHRYVGNKTHTVSPKILYGDIHTSFRTGGVMAWNHHGNASLLQPLSPDFNYLSGVILTDREKDDVWNHYSGWSLIWNVHVERVFTVLPSSYTDSSIRPWKSCWRIDCRHSSSQSEALYTGMITDCKTHKTETKIIMYIYFWNRYWLIDIYASNK